MVTCSGPTAAEIWPYVVGSTYFTIYWNHANYCWEEQSYTKSYNVFVTNKRTNRSHMYWNVKCSNTRCQLNVTSLEPSNSYAFSVQCNADVCISEITEKTIDTKPLPGPPKTTPKTPSKQGRIIRIVLEYAVGVGMVVLLAASVVLYVARIRENCALDVFGRRTRNASDVIGDLNESFEPGFVDPNTLNQRRRCSLEDDQYLGSSSSHCTMEILDVDLKGSERSYNHYLPNESDGGYISNLGNQNGVDECGNIVVNRQFFVADSSSDNQNQALRKKRRRSTQVMFNVKDRLPPILDLPEPPEEEEEEQDKREEEEVVRVEVEGEEEVEEIEMEGEEVVEVVVFNEDKEVEEEEEDDNSSQSSTPLDYSAEEPQCTDLEEPCCYVNICRNQIN